MTLRVHVETRLGPEGGGFTLAADFVSEGRITALFGRSGAGKSTLVNLIAGLMRPDRGTISLDSTTLFDSRTGIDLPAHRRRIGYVFQEGRLFPHLSVRANLLYGRRFTPKRNRWGSLDEIVELLGIGALLDRRPAGLSGGEKQRAAIGRALLSSPELLLMDEPLASLDQERKGEILPYIERLRDRMRMPIVYVSHTVDEVSRLADTVVLLDHGKVVAVGSVNEVLGARAEAYADSAETASCSPQKSSPTTRRAASPASPTRPAICRCRWSTCRSERRCASGSAPATWRSPSAIPAASRSATGLPVPSPRSPRVRRRRSPSASTSPAIR